MLDGLRIDSQNARDKMANEPSLCSLSLIFFFFGPLLNNSCDGILPLSNVINIKSSHFNC